MQFERIHRPDKRTRRAPFTIHNIAYKVRDRPYDTPHHTHKDYQLFMCVAHGVIAQVDGKDITLAPGQSVITPPQIDRQYRQLDTPPEYIIVHFMPDEAKINDVNRLTETKLSVPADAKSLIQRLVDELYSPGTVDSELMLYSLTSQLLIELMREARARNKPHLQEDERVSLLEQFIANNYHRPLGREDFADAVALSPSHVGHLYRSLTGKTLIDSLTEVRIDEAKRLLEHSTLPITYIALEVGFNSFSHFTQLFKRHVGVSPSVFRG